jgi:hypothetical protein
MLGEEGGYRPPEGWKKKGVDRLGWSTKAELELELSWTEVGRGGGGA